MLRYLLSQIYFIFWAWKYHHHHLFLLLLHASFHHFLIKKKKFKNCKALSWIFVFRVGTVKSNFTFIFLLGSSIFYVTAFSPILNFLMRLYLSIFYVLLQEYSAIRFKKRKQEKSYRYIFYSIFYVSLYSWYNFAQFFQKI